MAYDFKIKVADQAVDKEFISSVASIMLDQYIDRHHVLKIVLHSLGAKDDMSAFVGTQEFSGFLGETISLKYGRSDKRYYHYCTQPDNCDGQSCKK